MARRLRSTQVAANLCHCAKDRRSSSNHAEDISAARLSRKGKLVDWQPGGDGRRGRLSPYQVARPPGVVVTLTCERHYYGQLRAQG